LSIGHGAPAITASISDISRGHFVIFWQPLAVTCCKKQKDEKKNEARKYNSQIHGVINCYYRKKKQQQYNFNMEKFDKASLHMAWPKKNLKEKRKNEHRMRNHQKWFIK
jgi:hypothetical protein